MGSWAPIDEEATTPKAANKWAPVSDGDTPATAPLPKLSYEQAVAEGLLPDTRISAGEAAAQDVNQMLDPEIAKRANFVPLGRNKEGEIVFAVPQSALDVFGFTGIPGKVAQGYEPTLQDVFDVTSVAAPTSVASRLSGGKPLMNMLRKKPNPAPVTSATLLNPELKAALAKQGIDLPDLEASGMVEVVARQFDEGLDPEQIARKARFDLFEVPATQGDITQNFVQQTAEQRLESMMTEKAGAGIRQFRHNQSNAFIDRINKMIDGLGMPEEVGASIKEALSGRKELLIKEKNELYRTAGKMADEVGDIPIFTKEIENALPGAADKRRLRNIIPSQVNAVDELLVEFGIDKSPDAVASFVNSGGEITPLSVANFEIFRQALNQLKRSDTTGAVDVLINPIKNALDNEAVLIDDALRDAGVVDRSIRDAFKDARDSVRNIKTEFDPQTITGKLIGYKRGGVQEVVAASQVAQKLISPKSTPEDLGRVISSLAKAGGQGRQAISNLQSQVILDALEKGLKAPSRKMNGVQTINGEQFAKHLDSIGMDKLRILFKNKPKELHDLMSLAQIGKDISPPAAAVPRGSAPVILDALRRFGRLPGIAAAVDIAEHMITAGADDRAVRKAIEKVSPEVRSQIKTIRRQYPALASTLGIPPLINEELTEAGIVNPPVKNEE